MNRPDASPSTGLNNDQHCNTVEASIQTACGFIQAYRPSARSEAAKVKNRRPCERCRKRKQGCRGGIPCQRCREGNKKCVPGLKERRGPFRMEFGRKSSKPRSSGRMGQDNQPKAVSFPLPSLTDAGETHQLSSISEYTSISVENEGNEDSTCENKLPCGITSSSFHQQHITPLQTSMHAGSSMRATPQLIQGHIPIGSQCQGSNNASEACGSLESPNASLMGNDYGIVYPNTTGHSAEGSAADGNLAALQRAVDSAPRDQQLDLIASFIQTLEALNQAAQGCDQ